MDTRGFLEKVIAWDVDGYTAICWQKAQSPWNTRFVKTLDEAMAFLDKLKTTHSNIYFSIARFETVEGKRTRDNALAFRAIPFDLDVGPGDDDRKYHSINEAWTAMFRFCQALSIPNPSLLVASGSGIHCYFCSFETLGRDVWFAYASALKQAAIRYGLKFDPSVTADAARVLRVPGEGFINVKRKEPAPVQISPRLFYGEHDFATIFTFANVGFGSIGVDVQPGPAFIQDEAVNANHPHVSQQKFSKTVPGFEVAPEFQDIPVEDMAGETEDLPPLPLAPILEGCEYLRIAYETGGKEYNNFHWMTTTHLCTWIEDGNAVAHKMACGHSTYRHSETESMWQRKYGERGTRDLGWTRCSTIANHGSECCKSCPLFAEFSAAYKSPLHLGLDAARTKSHTNGSGGEASGTMATPASSLYLPEGFTTGDHGEICAKVPHEKKIKGNKIAIVYHRLSVFLTKITDPYPIRKGGIGFIALIAQGPNLPPRPEPIRLERGDIKRSNFANTLMDNGVMVNGKKQAGEWLNILGPSWMEKLREKVPARDVEMGWCFEEDKRIGFTYGPVFFGCDGSQDESRLPVNDQLYKYYMPRGKPEPWFQAAKLLTDRQCPELDIILAVPFASPLATFLGNFYGGILSIWGDPGTAKSTAQQVAAAVWGHPKQTRESLDSTKKSVLFRLGKTRNLPCYWDDIQDDVKLEHLFNTMFLNTQGSEGGRLTSDVQYRERLEWQTMMVACSNASFVEYVIKKQPSTTAGLRRVLEIEFKKPEGDVGMIDVLDAMQAFGALEYNFGHVGMQYAKLIATKHEEIKAFVEKVTKEFKSKVDGKADEAYWWGIAALLLSGAFLARRLGAEMNVERMEEFLIEAFKNNRTIRASEGTEGGSPEHTDAALAQFLNFYLGSGYRVDTETRYKDRFTPVVAIRGPNQGRPIYIQVVREGRIILISKRALKEFLEDKEIKTRQVFDGLVKYYGAKQGKLVLGGGTEYAAAQEQVIEIEVKDDKLWQIVNAQDRTQADDQVYGRWD